MKHTFRILLDLGIFGFILSNSAAEEPLSFNKDIRQILSQNCFHCHGPDEKTQEGGLRLDVKEGAIKDGAIVPGKPEESELIFRITTDDPDEVMPPPKSKLPPLTKEQKDTLRKWIKQGAPYQKHWSYIKPERPALPELSGAVTPSHPVDRFVQKHLEGTELKPAPKADNYVLLRRLSMDLTGLPPSLETLHKFPENPTEQDWSDYVDSLLNSPAYGEHWARQWLDLARYADSAGYADDQPRTIWGYRDWVIRAFNENKPFDEFTIEQIAGDLLPDASPDQLAATAFHRNTQTNNEGGTNDEEFRNAAVIDRVNTTMAVWMGTTMNCAQCHTHKYDPISQEEYFQFFAILNNTEDADRRNEDPTMQIFSKEQKQEKIDNSKQLEELKKELTELKSKKPESLLPWLTSFSKAVDTLESDFENNGKHIAIEIPEGEFDGIAIDSKLATTPEDVTFELKTPDRQPGKLARYVRVYNLVNSGFLHLAEVQVFSGSENIALKGKASQISTDYGGSAQYGNDGNTDGDYNKKSVTHTAMAKDPWWEVDLGQEFPISKIAIWNRTDGDTATRIQQFRIELYDNDRKSIWKKDIKQTPNPSYEERLSSDEFIAAHPWPRPGQSGWYQFGKPLKAKSGKKLILQSKDFAKSPPTKVQFIPNLPTLLKEPVPKTEFAVLSMAPEQRTPQQKQQLQEFHVNNLPEVVTLEKEVKDLSDSLRNMKPYTTIPIMRELEGTKRRKTHIQIRGNFLIKDKEVNAGLPAVFHPGKENPNRLDLAQWLISPENPLTARVVANRYWEALFGIGLVASSEEFGSQGELPSHPELLDWLATELIRIDWDLKKFLKLLVSSHTYQQDSKVLPAHLEHDPTNRLLARGPRQRLSAEMVRDLALHASGLLSTKMYGPPIKPPQPSMGLSAAFGPGLDWQDSKGEDKFRRGIYVHWRRTNPYPSMVAFDAPNRFVCNVRRTPTNTPLQALVTLNDPVYIETAQALARRLVAEGGDSDESRIKLAWKLCLSRDPSEMEILEVKKLLQQSRKLYADDPNAAKTMATDPIGPLPDNADAAELAALTVASNIILNLDEIFQKR
jgi:hypothetical protein